MASGEYDQSEELLHVSCIMSFLRFVRLPFDVAQSVFSLVPVCVNSCSWYHLPNVPISPHSLKLSRCHREYLKRDDQILPLRLQQEERRHRMTTNAKDRDRALAQSKPGEAPMPDIDMDLDDDVGMDEGIGQDAFGSKIIVLHPGSQNLRIGLASDAIPKTIPMMIARRWDTNESEEDRGEPKPKRMKYNDGATMEPEKMFGEEVCLKPSSRTVSKLTMFSLQVSTQRCARS